jgi:glycerophosphoryl diester phosphodiesterase
MVHHDYELGRLTEGRGALLNMHGADLKAVRFKATADRMMTLGDLCDLVAGRVPLVLELKSTFSGDRRLIRRIKAVLANYRGPVAAMSFDPDQVLGLRREIPSLVRGIVAERRYDDGEWQQLPADVRRHMTGLRHGFETRPHFVAYRVDDLPAPAPWIARHLFGCALLTWTVRTPAQRDNALRYADQMIFEGFRPA